MKTKIAVILILVFTFSIRSESQVYKDASKDIELRVADLLSRMSLDEKIMQLNQGVLGLNNNDNNIESASRSSDPLSGSFIYFGFNPELRNKVQKRAIEETRLGIPILFGYDIIHGFRTIYPISLAQACSWNPQLVTNACNVAASEGKLAGINWTFSPMIDIARDPRWGRISEGYGEDPYTNAIFGVASVKGYQGKSLSDTNSIAACLKHYVGYGASEGGRDYVYTEISQQTLWDTYLVPYKACVEAGAATLMSGFNDISGIPASANYLTLTKILKEQWHHQGFVVSDWDAVKQLINQRYAKDDKEACFKAFTAGVEMDMVDQLYKNNLKTLIDEGKVNKAQIDDAVSRILRVKFKLGLFEKPYTPEVSDNKRFLQPASIETASQLAEQSMVLLKNKDSILPIKPNITKIAVIGPLAKSQEHILGSWSAFGKAEDATSVFDGLNKQINNKTELLYAPGCNFDGDDQSGFAEAQSIAAQADLIVLCLGEKRNWSGENGSRASIALPAIQEKLATEIKKTGKPILLILSNGRPLELTRLEPLADAIVEMWQPGITGGTAVAKIITGKVNPSGKLAVTFPLSSTQIPIYYCRRNSARTGNQGLYQDISSDPFYPFGYGLTYTKFSYGPIKVSSQKISKTQTVVAEIKVTNTGQMDGYETVHWFVSDLYASVTRPIKELKYFEKKMIKKGESVVFKFEINPMRDLSFPDATGKILLENGEFNLMVLDQKIQLELTD
jgi:beta-glucosidase